MVKTDPEGFKRDGGHHHEVVPSNVEPEEKNRLLEILRADTVGGLLLVIAAVISIVWANSPASAAYFYLRDFAIGIPAFDLYLSVGQWASDGLLAIFFFLVGLELKREFVEGGLRQFSTAIQPITAAAGGVIVPALIYVVLVINQPDLSQGWPIPTATDIAFAVSVLALIGKFLPASLRIFLLTLAVVDDLIAIGIIVFFYSQNLRVIPMILSAAVMVLYAFLVQKYRDFFYQKAWAAWAILLPIAFVAWGFMHASGIHATIAGVILAFTVPVKAAKRGASDGDSLVDSFEHRFGPLSTGFAVPVFAFFSAGVNVGGLQGFVGSLAEPVTIAIIAALVVGKPIGITLTTWVLTRFPNVSLNEDVKWIDLIGVAALAGVGFTVSLLVAALSFELGSPDHSYAKVGILVASMLAILVSSLILVPRNRHYKNLQAAKGSNASD